MNLALDNLERLICHKTQQTKLNHERTKHFFIKNIYLVLFLKGVHSLLLVETEMERHILREETSSCPISSSESLRVPALAPPCKPRRLWSAASPSPDSRFSALCLNLPAWFSSRGLLSVTHLLDLTALTRCPVY